MAPRNLSIEQQREFGNKITDEFQAECVQDKDRLCQYASGQEARIVYAYNLGRIDEDQAIEQAKQRKQAMAKYCLSGIEVDGTRTVCHFNTADPREHLVE